MQTSEPQSELDKLRAFELRMQTEGAAGFANGLEPWTQWQEPHESEGKRMWGCDRERKDVTAGKSLCERILTTMASLAVATLAVGIGGVYFSAQSVPPMAQHDTEPTATVAALDAPEIPEQSRTDRALSRTVATTDSSTIAAAPQPAAPAAETIIAATAEGDVELPTVTEPSLAADDRLTSIAQQSPHLSTPPTISTNITLADITADLPAPAAGMDTTEPASTDAVLPPRADSSTLEKTVAMPVPIDEPADRESPIAVSMAASPVEPVTTPAKAVADEAPKGPWVVNISSYTYESMARRMLKEFRDKGVVAEIHPVTIKGKPMYRIRATGYESRKEAKTWLSLLEDRLGVESAWVSKR